MSKNIKRERERERELIILEKERVKESQDTHEKGEVRKSQIENKHWKVKEDGHVIVRSCVCTSAGFVLRESEGGRD